MAEPPRGLVEMLEAIKEGSMAKGKDVSADVDRQVLTRFHDSFAQNESHWDQQGGQVLSVAGLVGRLAALYEKSGHVHWAAAKEGLKDAQQECRLLAAPSAKRLTILGKWCSGVDLDRPIDTAVV